MIDDLISDRKKKLERYKNFKDPYPARVSRTHKIFEARRDFEKLLKSLKKISLTGRIFSIRDQGKIIFFDMRDEGGKFQIVASENECKNFNILRETIQTGDFCEAKGNLFETKKGEKSLKAVEINIITKSIRPIPDEWYGLEDIETIQRKRYLDLLLNEKTKELFRKKEVFWDSIRTFLKKNKFNEIETPVLEHKTGGAEARPFITKMNALNQDLYLRISLELPLKKLLVAGYEKVFEIGRIFRNEGIDREHLQDYTQMECYASYWDYKKMMKFVEKMYIFTIKKTFGTLNIKSGGEAINWELPWDKIDYYDVFKKNTGIDLKKVSVEELRKFASSIGLEFEKHSSKGRLIDLIYKKSVRPFLIKPCFLIDPPVEIEPLAKRTVYDKNRVERFQILAYGTELGKGFSELNDPIDQRERFKEQLKLREAGDEEAQMFDSDFLEALEYGMPPAGGFGMSERLFAVLSDVSVREAVIFPIIKKEGLNK